MKRVMQQTSPPPDALCARHVHRAQAGRPARPRRRTCRSCATAIPIRPKRRPSRPERASDANGDRHAGARTAADTTPSPRARGCATGREAAGLSIDAVAQQLKLAPRQVAGARGRTISRKLPGRTFVRGFMRNYARLLRLDPTRCWRRCPRPARAPSLDHPSLAPTHARRWANCPPTSHGKPSSARWAIPLALIAVVAMAAVYEFTRPLAEPPKPVPLDKPAAPVAPTTPRPTPRRKPRPASTTTPLPNPLAAADARRDGAPDAATPRDGRRRAGGNIGVAAERCRYAARPVRSAARRGSKSRRPGALIVLTTWQRGRHAGGRRRAPLEVVLGNAAR